MEDTITLRILSRNRKEFLLQTLESALAQKKPFAEVQLYDNASDFDLGSLKKKFPQLEVRGFLSPVSAKENLRRALADPIASPWLCVFHDDDMFTPDFVLRLLDTSKKCPGAAALSCNGIVIDSLGNKQDLLLPKLKQAMILKNPTDLALCYCDGFVPFPPTLYRWHENLGQEFHACQGFGRCVDVAFLAKVVARAPIVVDAESLFLYRRHSKQDSEGFEWWEESRRWQLQMGLCEKNSGAQKYVQRKRNDRLTSRWLNAWLWDQPRPEPWAWSNFSPGAAWRFFRNQKIRVLKKTIRPKP